MLRRIVPVCISAFLILLLWTAEAIRCHAQERAPECSASDLDITYEFLNQDASERVAVNYRNLTDHPCTLRPGMGFAYGGNGHSLWVKECRNCDEHGQTKMLPAITVAPGNSVHTLVQWETKPTKGGPACEQLGEINSNISQSQDSYDIWSTSLLSNICSPARVDSYLPGVFPGTKDNEQQATKVKVRLAASGDLIYSMDSFWLYMTVEDPDHELAVNSYSCPPLFFRVRSPGGYTSLQEVSGRCRVIDGTSLGHAYLVVFSTVGWGMFGGVGQRSVNAKVLLGPAHAPHVRMVTSNTVEVKITTRMPHQETGDQRRRAWL